MAATPPQKAVGTTANTIAAGDDTRIVGAAQKASNLSDLASVSTARTNLGLGNSATKNVGTTTGTVAAGDDPRIVAGANAATLTGKLIVATGTAFRAGVAADIPDLSASYIVPTGNASGATTTGSRAGEIARPFSAHVLEAANVKDFGAVGDGSTDDTVAIQAAITYALTRKCRVYFPAGIYKITAALDCRPTSGDNFKGCFGDGPEASIIIQYTSNTPVIRTSGRYQSFEKLSVCYASQAAITDTNSIAIRLEGWVFFCAFRDLYIYNGYKGLGSYDIPAGQTAALFSNSFDNIRLQNHQYACISAGGSAGGTQNHWSNIYCSNAGLASVFRLIELNEMFENTFNVLNTEHSTVRDCAIANINGDNLTINGWHVEAINLYGYGTNGSEAYATSLLYTSGRGATVIRGLGIVYLFTGPLFVSSITRSGTAATMTVNNLSHTVSINNGHGIRAGDSFTIRGASDSAWNTTFTATSVTLTTVSFTCAGTETTPAVASADYIAANIGNAAFTTSAIVKTVGNADTVSFDGVRIRSSTVRGASAGDRSIMFRLGWELNLNGSRLKFNNLALQGLPSNAQYLAYGSIVGLSRTSNVATAYTLLPHRLRNGDAFRVNGSSDSGYNQSRLVVSIVDDYSFTYNSTGSDSSLAKQASTRLVLQTAATTFRAKSSNVATLTTSSAHGFIVGQRLAIDNLGGSGYTGTDSVVLSVPSSTTFTYYSAGSNESSTSDSGGIIQLLDVGLSATNYSTPSNSVAIVDADWLYLGQACLDFGGAISLLTAATQAVAFVGCFVGDRVIFTPRTAFNDGLVVTAAVLANGTITFRAYNTTSGSITPTATITRFSLERN